MKKIMIGLILVLLLSGCVYYSNTKEQCLDANPIQLEYCECLAARSDGTWRIGEINYEYCESKWVNEE